MLIFRMVDPFDYDYARASLRGTWTSGDGICPDCTASSEERVQPLIIEWEPDSDLVGDFVWPDFSFDLAISNRVLELLQRYFSGFEPGPVEMVQDPKLKRTSRSKPRVWLPYEGPRLFDLWVTFWAPLDHEASTISQREECTSCGRKKYEVHGIERRATRWDSRQRKAYSTHHPREPGKGLYVRESGLKGADIFRLEEFPGCILCTEEVKSIVEAAGFTNAGFLAMGEIISD